MQTPLPFLFFITEKNVVDYRSTEFLASASEKIVDEATKREMNEQITQWRPRDTTRRTKKTLGRQRQQGRTEDVVSNYHI